MSGSLLAIILIAIVVPLALAVWIAAVFCADRHPEPGPGEMPGTRSSAARSS